MPDGQILHACCDGIHVLRLIGEVRYPLAPAFDAFIKRLFEGPAPAGVVIDLTETQALDSTNLGLLARIAMRLQAAGTAGRPTIVCHRPDINEVLLSMGFDEVFHLVTADGRPCAGLDGAALPAAEGDEAAMARTLLDAHRALIEMSEGNRALFADVVAQLEQEAGGG